MGIVIFAILIIVGSSFAMGMDIRMHQGSIGEGAKYMSVAYGNNTYVEIWYSPSGGYLNATAIDAYTGVIKASKTLSTDVYTFNGAPSIRPMIVYDCKDEGFMVFWVNSSRYLEGLMIDSNLNVLMNEFTVNETYGVSYKGIAAEYGNNTVLVVWSNTHYQLVGRFINKTYFGPEFRITKFNSYSQQKPWIGYDNISKRFMVVWTNVTTNSTNTRFYNITARIIGVGDVNYTGDITVGDAYSTHDSFTAPTVSGGGNHFLITYVEYGKPYGIIAMLYNSNGVLVSNITIGHTYYYGRNSMPTIFNGTVFIAVWSNSTESILSAPIDMNGTMGQIKVIYDGNNGGNPVMAYSPDDNTYFFSWTEYGRATAYGLSYLVITNEEYVPEFGTMLPLLIVLIAAVIVWRRKN